MAEWFNAAGFKKDKKKSVSSVILASEVQSLPSPLQLSSTWCGGAVGPRLRARWKGSGDYYILLRLIPLIRCQGINMSSYVISWCTSSLASPLVYLSSSSSRFRRWSITAPYRLLPTGDPRATLSPHLPEQRCLPRPMPRVWVCPPRGSSLSYSHHVSLPLSPPPCCPLERLSAPLVAGPMQG